MFYVYMSQDWALVHEMLLEIVFVSLLFAEQDVFADSYIYMWV